MSIIHNFNNRMYYIHYINAFIIYNSQTNIICTSLLNRNAKTQYVNYITRKCVWEYMYPILYNFFAMFFILYKNVSLFDHKKRKISFQFQHKLQKYLSFRNICYSFIYSAKIHHNLKAEIVFYFIISWKFSWIFINMNTVKTHFSFKAFFNIF